MAAKKTPAKKAAPAKKAESSKTPTPPKRTDKAGSSGMGMTKTGVEQRAMNAAFESMIGDAKGGSLEFGYRPNSNLLKSLGLTGGTFKKGYESRAAAAANKVRKKYGVTPKKSK